ERMHFELSRNGKTDRGNNQQRNHKFVTARYFANEKNGGEWRVKKSAQNPGHAHHRKVSYVKVRKTDEFKKLRYEISQIGTHKQRRRKIATVSATAQRKSGCHGFYEHGHKQEQKHHPGMVRKAFEQRIFKQVRCVVFR